MKRMEWTLGVVVATGVAALFGGSPIGLKAQQGAPAPAQQGPGQPAPTPARGGGGGRGDNSGADFGPRPAVRPQSPADEAASFILPPGYRMELVASEPDIVNPNVVEFDGNGRMYVSEIRSYMLDADGSHEHDPISRISRWESTKGDGKYDKHTVFVDHLVLPRMILPLEDGSILTNETDSDDVVKWTDTNGDGVADKREVFYTGVGTGRDGNLEHEQSGFVWGLDNWIYSTYNAFRFRWTPNGILREPTGPNGGQWGLSMDDDGKMWFVDAGGERGPVNFQFPIEYGGFTPCGGGGQRGGFGGAPGAGAAAAAPAPAPVDPNCPPAFERDFETVWPVAGVGDMQGGMGRVRMPAGTLNHFTATNGPAIVRGDRMPADLQGDLLFDEPVGRLIRRAKIVKTEGLTQLRNAYPQSEFVLSRDLMFRPVNIRTAPDGTIFVVDMYHGIIQESQWTPPGSYLRTKVEQYGLDKATGYGRIWRLRYDGTPEVAATATTLGQPARAAIQPDLTQPRMLNETPAQLVGHFTSPNGWWRDTAQRLLVLKQDKSVVPALQQMARSSTNVVSRFHALWTLEGLGALDAGLVREAMKDAEPRMRVQAIRASETLYKAGDKSFEADYRSATKDQNPDVVIQAMLTLSVLKVSGLADVVRSAEAGSSAVGVKEIGNHLLTPPANNAGGGGGGRGGAALTPEQQNLLDQGRGVYTELCFTCHGDDGRGRPLEGAAPGVTMAPPLAGSPRVNEHRDYILHVLLGGLTGPLDDKTYTEVMVPMGQNPDEWIASVASYVRNNFGNAAGFVTPADVARVRAATTSRKTQWTVPEIERALPKMLDSQGWKLTASHNSDTAAAALTLRPWTSGIPQTPGVWLQVELPQVTTISEIQFDSTAGRGGGGGGRGAAGAAGAGRGAGGAGRQGAPGQPGVAPGNPLPPGAAPAGTPGAGAPGAGAATAPAAPLRGYQVQVSTNGSTWGSPLATLKTSDTHVAIIVKPVAAKFVRITQTEAAANGPNWAVSGLRIFAAGQ